MTKVTFFVIFWILISFAWVRVTNSKVESKLWGTLEHILVLPYTIIMILGFAFQIISIRVRAFFDKSNESDSN